jgi:hypothetical protein
MQPARTTDASPSASRRRRYVAPTRDSIDPGCFDAPIFDGYRAYADWMLGAGWPSIDALNAKLGEVVHAFGGQSLHFVPQTAHLLGDGLHYERRIFEQGAIATRAGSWHDLFNAMVWIEHARLKAALNRRQADDVGRAGPDLRTRAQCALTHFDEGGAIVLLRDRGLLDAWDAHDWTSLFVRRRDAWRDGRAQVVVFGHALLEHALQAHPVHTAKCIALLDLAPAPPSTVATNLSEAVASAVASGEVLLDPQELRPLPLSGIPTWHPNNGDAAFYRDAPCFRPLRSGRRYPPPLTLRSGSGAMDRTAASPWADSATQPAPPPA